MNRYDETGKSYQAVIEKMQKHISRDESQIVLISRERGQIV